MSTINLGKLDTIDINTSNIVELAEAYNSNFEKLNIAIDNISYLPMTCNITTVPNTPVEKGTVLDSITLNWTYNKRVISQSIDEEVLHSTVRSKTFNERITSNKNYVFRYQDSTKEYSKTYTVQFTNGVYYGTNSSDTLTNDQILSMTKKLTSSKSMTFSVNAINDQYIYYVLPSSYGKPIFKVGGFEGGFSKVSTLQFTNSLGYTESYDVWRSSNRNLGNTTVVVS